LKNWSPENGKGWGGREPTEETGCPDVMREKIIGKRRTKKGNLGGDTANWRYAQDRKVTNVKREIGG